MPAGVLIISHNRVGATMLETAKFTWAKPTTISTQLLAISKEHDSDVVFTRGCELVNKLETGDGVLILTDAWGATPSNIANRLRCAHDNIRVVTGLNLPMLLTLFGNDQLQLPALADKLVEAGQRGIIQC